MQMSKRIRSQLFSLIVSLGISSGIQAQTTVSDKAQVLVHGNGAEITTTDLEVESQKIPADARRNLLSSPERLSRVATNLYMRRALANEAEKKGLSADPKVAAALQIARDRVLSDAAAAEMDANVRPDDSALESYALANYKTQSSRFIRKEEIRAAHLLIASNGDESRQKANELLKQLRSGADFAELAKAHSIDKSNAGKGGDLGFFNRDKMVKPFSDAAFALKTNGEVSDLVETQFGIHIIKLTDRTPEGVRPFAEVRETLRAEAIAKMQNDLRMAQEQRLTQSAVFDHAAIEAFAEKNK